MTMNEDILDLDGFKELEQQVIQDTADVQITRSQFDHGLIIVTEVHKADKRVKLHSNFAWEQHEAKWHPDLANVNLNFKDPLIQM